MGLPPRALESTKLNYEKIQRPRVQSSGPGGRRLWEAGTGRCLPGKQPSRREGSYCVCASLVGPGRWGSYAKSWEAAAAYFKTAVSQADWEKAVQAVRPPLGKLISRQIKSQQYATSMPGAPDGEYVVIQCDSTFENKAHAIETVTPMLDKDGQWRVSGYYIK